MINFESTIFTPHDKGFDILWCHDAFQYCINPIETLIKWRNITNPGGMLALIVPQTVNIQQQKLSFVQPSGCFYHYSMVNLIHLLSITGWDCKTGFFLKEIDDPFIHCVVYKSEQEPLDPKTTTWYDLVDKKLLPDTADASIMGHGYLRQQDLIVPWLDHNLTWMAQR